MASKKLIKDFEAFREHCIEIRSNYNTHHDLFLSGADVLLNNTASTFFYELSEIMVNYWIVRVCAIMDPAETKRKGEVLENITIDLIDKQLMNEGLKSDEINGLSDELKKYGEQVKQARNKRIVHLDRFYRFNDVILGATPIEDLDTFLDNLQKYCDEVGRAIGVGPLDFSSSRGPGDVLDLLKVLREYHRGHDHEY